MKTRGTGRHTECQANRSLVPDIGERLGEVEAQTLVKQLADKLAEVLLDTLRQTMAKVKF